MEESAIIQYFAGKTILITGATGFLAKIFVEKILRVQPNVKKLFLLIRETTKTSANQRLEEEIIDSELFGVLRGEFGSEFKDGIKSRLIPISGDVSRENLGIDDLYLREEMCQEIDIIVNLAATTKFDERYDIAFGINVLGSMNVQDFARNCPKLEMLLHVSTAFVRGKSIGLINERPFQMGETLDGSILPYLDINVEKKIIEERLQELQIDRNTTENEIARAMKDLGIQRAKMHGWPNTYVFTKAMGEMLLGTIKEKNNVIIIRPTIVTSTYKEPFPGWIEGVRTLDSIFVAYGRGKLNFFVGDPESIPDLIPGDMVVNCMLTAIASHSNDGQRDLFVYQIGSSRRNPVRYAEIKWLTHRYLIENPLLDNNGTLVKIGKPTTFNTMAGFHNYIHRRYLPFLKVLECLNTMFCNRFESWCSSTRRRLNSALRLVDLYEPYLFYRGIFDDDNTENLRRRVRGSNINVDTLNFDPTLVQWDEYFLNTHFPGIVKYALK